MVDTSECCYRENQHFPLGGVHVGERQSISASLKGIWQAIHYACFPHGCVGCGFPDCTICAVCASSFFRMQIALTSKEIFSYGGFVGASVYEGAVRQAILAWKDHRDFSLESWWNVVMRHLIVQCLSSGTWQEITANKKIVLIPVPSTRHSRIVRGFEQTMVLAQIVQKILQSYGLQTTIIRALSLRHTRHKSVELGNKQDRAKRIRSSLSIVRSGIRKLRHFQEKSSGTFAYRNVFSTSSMAIILIDDIATSGTTLQQCASVLRECGYQVHTALVLAMGQNSNK